MFYSHEILTSRKYGVATVWLVATLGAKSNARKVSKKAILEVNLKKACQTIMEPEAPMALRLQSNLLYGVSRVYDQQCGYVLHDAQAAQLKLRELLKVVQNHDLDLSATRARTDQLMLVDDPAFLPDMALPALDFDFSNFGIDAIGDSQRSSQSMLSVRNRSGSLSSHVGSGIGFDFPSSSTNRGAYQLPMDDPFSASAQKEYGETRRDIFGDEEENLYQDDMVFEFDAEGNMRDIDIDERVARRAGSVLPSIQGYPESGSAADGRVRKEHEDAAATFRPHKNGEGDLDIFNFGDDGYVLPEAEPFSDLAGRDQRAKLLLAEEEGSQYTFSESAEAPAKRRKEKKARKLDETIQLRTADLLGWQNEYLEHMAAASVAVARKKEIAQAKVNAEAWLFGNGLNGIGRGIGTSALPLPLAMFSGAAFLSKITGQPILETSRGKKSLKRDSPIGNEDSEQASPSKRVRQDDNDFAFPHDDEIVRGNFDDDMRLGDDSSSGVEIGREAPSALADYPSSAMMPWNVSASLHSHRRGSSIPGRPGSTIAGSARHMRSASPLVGRGSNIPGSLDQFSSQLDEMVQYGRSDNESEIARSRRPESLRSFDVNSSHSEFQIFGPAANVDTQTAANSQWVRDALDRESNNFLEYVRNTIEEQAGDELDEPDGGEDDIDILGPGRSAGEERTVTFSQLFEPKNNSKMVAAQAFYHVLSLATKRRVWVQQELDEDVLQPYGEIRIGVIA